MPGYMVLYEPNLKSALKIDDFPIFRHLPYKKLLQILTYPGFPYHILSQEALNIWRGKLFHFFQILCNHMYPKVIVISIVDLQKTNNFAKFGGCCSKNLPATSLRILKWSRAWQAYFLSYHFQIQQKVEILLVQKLVKIWC